MCVTTYCSNRAGAKTFLYLPKNWNKNPWVGISNNISSMTEFPFWEYQGGEGRLYIIKQGSIWRPGGTHSDVLWRIRVMFYPSLYFINKKSLWQSTRTGELLEAEKVTFDELLLEELFL